MPHDITPELFENERAFRFDGREWIDHRRQWLVLDLDQIDRVLGSRAVHRSNCGHGVTGKPHFLGGKTVGLDREGTGIRERSGPLSTLHVLTREHCIDSGKLAAASASTRTNARVRMRAADQSGMCHARKLEVVDEDAGARREPLVFAAGQRTPNPAAISMQSPVLI